MRARYPIVAAAVVFALVSILHAQVPQVINYQGRVAVGGVNFNGTGTFNFALVNAAGTASYWTNDGTHSDGTQPSSSVSLSVNNGLYSVLLGDTTVPNMTAIPASVFTNSSVWLRVWFNDGTHGAQLLSPDQRIASVGYAIVAGSVPNGAIGLAQLGLGTIGGQVVCNGTDPTHTYVYLRGTSALAYVGNANAGNYPFQLTLVPPGTYTVVAHLSNGSEFTTQVTVAAGQSVANVSITTATFATDPNNCGACGNVCSSANGTAGCTSGNCGITCNTGYGNCDGNIANGCETNVLTSVANCGSCGTVCSPGANVSTVACSGGACGIASCNPGYADCDHLFANGCEANILTNANNCGGCGINCQTGQVCTNGSCVNVCSSPLVMCASVCVNEQTDTNNCGGCGVVCSTGANATATCTSGACGITCNTGFGNCDQNPNNGCEVSLLTSASNCGSCGHACAQGHTCSAGVCN